jgi:lipoate-protein ligase A
MYFLDLTLPTPAENLACDEALLDAAEEGGDTEVLRFWESPSSFVVLGSSNHASREVDLDACMRDGIPVLRRRSGGGAVLQGSGCLSYCLILKMEGQCSTIAGTNSFVLQRHAGMLSTLLGKPVRHEGLTDLAIDGVKFSGNSQRRRMRSLMFHGTFLLGFDLGMISRYLRSPSKEPAYRNGRRHEQFLMNIPLTSGQVKEALKSTWESNKPMASIPMDRLQALVRERYGMKEWNLKY